MQNFIKLSAALHELSWLEAFLPYLAITVITATSKPPALAALPL